MSELMLEIVSDRNVVY